MTVPPVVRYSLLRLLVLLVVGALLFLSGLRGFALLVLSFVLSGVVSLVLLRRTRGEVAEGLAARVERRGERPGLVRRIGRRIDAANRAEDEALDAAEAAQAQGRDEDDAAGGGDPEARRA